LKQDGIPVSEEGIAGQVLSQNRCNKLNSSFRADQARVPKTSCQKIALDINVGINVMGQPPFQPFIKTGCTNIDELTVGRAKTGAPEPGMVAVSEALIRSLRLKPKAMRLTVPESGRDGRCVIFVVEPYRERGAQHCAKSRPVGLTPSGPAERFNKGSVVLCQNDEADRFLGHAENAFGMGW